MNEEKEPSKQFLNQEALKEGKEDYQEKSVEKQQERKDFFREGFEKRLIEEKMEEELEKMEIEPGKLEEEIEKEKQQIKTLKKEGKLNRLLNIAKERGVPFAVGVAKQMNDPYILDALHDILVRKGFYEKFLK